MLGLCCNISRDTVENGLEFTGRPSFDYFTENRINWLFAGINAVIFDLNGLILDDEPVQLAATNAALAIHGVTISEKEWIEQCVGRRPGDYIQQFLALPLDEPSQDRLIDARSSLYQQQIVTVARSLVRNGVETLLNYLRTHQIRIALGTSASRESVRTVLGPDGAALIDFFSSTVCGNEVTNPKPHPETYRMVAANMQLDSKACIVLEDSALGVQAAKRAGMKCIAVPNRFTAKQDLSLADMILSDLTPVATIQQAVK